MYRRHNRLLHAVISLKLDGTLLSPDRYRVTRQKTAQRVKFHNNWVDVGRAGGGRNVDSGPFESNFQTNNRVRRAHEPKVIQSRSGGSMTRTSTSKRKRKSFFCSARLACLAVNEEIRENLSASIKFSIFLPASHTSLPPLASLIASSPSNLFLLMRYRRITKSEERRRKKSTQSSPRIPIALALVSLALVCELSEYGNETFPARSDERAFSKTEKSRTQKKLDCCLCLLLLLLVSP